ncbi:branched-chain amino acid ABC transporter permease [Paralcaligenes ureilyticus]|uniref:Amino acid/amide ABC transporter membrane protein 2 (HAAT family) n=1 Tax=Paralcaligenes ureilyticus TaxID=627131 RepID=A0A4R3M150_9BURK|nr:branched-chain amino acid ABC transporter permease [Paralcaligenes ureilyticus]TCT04825.1 amino acid/amide ABC transporter membrane protein 2 (HAAT family) [Paralcaligenes ureilyticus]
MKLPIRKNLLVYASIAIAGGGIASFNSPFWVQLAIGVLISAILALAWDILSRTGQVTLASAAFFGLGAYGVGLLAPVMGIFLAWIATLIICALVAMLLGLLTLRLRKMYFAIATLGLSLSLQVLVLVFKEWTGGSGGLSPPVLLDGDPRLQLLAITGFVLIAALVSDYFLSDRLRPALFLVRTNPELAAASGIPVVRTRILVFTVSGVLAGISGALYGGLYGYVVPTDVFTINWSVLPLAIVILGGMDTTLGPILGALLIKAIEEIARAYIGGVGYQVVYGAIIILFVLFLPTGLMGLFKKIVAHLHKDPK